MLLQLKATHGWTDKSFKALLLLLKDMLPEGNLLPDTVYEAKQIVCPVGLKIEKKFMHAGIIVSCFVERMKIWTISLNVECRGTSVERMVVMMERTAWMRGRRGLQGKLHGTFLWFPDCSGCLQTRRRRSCCVGMRRAIIKTECYVTLQIVLNGDILITPMAGSGMILGILGLL